MSTTFHQWFSSKLVVGGFPYIKNSEFPSECYRHIINVSDEYYPDIQEKLTLSGCRTFWFPINEYFFDMGVNSIYGAMVCLWHAEKNNESAYLHCHAGIHRSQMVRCAYHFMRTQKHLDNEWLGFFNQLTFNCEKGTLPTLDKMERFLTELGAILVDQTEVGYGDLDTLKQQTLHPQKK